MEKEVDELRRVPGRVPRLTSEGIDFTGVPIDMVIKQAMAGSEVEFSGALGSAGNASGRHDYIGCAFYR